MYFPLEKYFILSTEKAFPIKEDPIRRSSKIIREDLVDIKVEGKPSRNFFSYPSPTKPLSWIRELNSFFRISSFENMMMMLLRRTNLMMIEFLLCRS